MTWSSTRNAPAEYASPLMYWPAHQFSGGGGLPFPSEASTAHPFYPPPPETRPHHHTEQAPPEQLPGPVGALWPPPDPVAAAPFGLGAHHRGGPMAFSGSLQPPEPIGCGAPAVGNPTAAAASLTAAAFAATAVAAAAPFVAPFVAPFGATPQDQPPLSAATVAAKRPEPSLNAVAFADSLAADFAHFAPSPPPPPQTLATEGQSGGDANKSLSNKSHKRAIDVDDDDDAETRERTCVNARNIRLRNKEQV